MIKQKTYIIFVFILLACVAGFLFARTWHNPFVLDDMTKIQFNPDLRATHLDLAQFVQPYAAQETSYRNDPSRPLTFECYWLVWHLLGGESWGFHLLNTILHLGCAILLFALVLKMLEGQARAAQAAGVAATLFLVSPLLADSVLYAFALSDLLATFFILSALLVHLRAEKFNVAEVVLFGLALASKQSAIVLPALFLLVDWAFARKSWRRYLPVGLTALIYLLVRLFYLGGVGDLEAHGEVYGPEPYLATEGLMILKYLMMILRPGGFSVDHFLKPELYSTLEKAAGWVGVFLISLGFLRLKKLKSLAWSWFFFLMCLIPTSSFLPTVDLFVERRAYLPAVGLYAGLGVLFLRARDRFPGRAFQILIMLSFLLKFSTNARLTWQRGEVFGSSEAIWQESLDLYPQSPRARLNLATTYSAHQRYPEAAQLLRGLLTQQPQNGVIYSKLGFIYAQNQNPERDLERAWSYYQESFKTEPNDVIALLNASSLLVNLGKLDRARQLLRHVLELSPRMAYAHYVSAQVSAADHKPEEARRELQTALNLDPGFREAKDFLAQLGAHP